MPHNLSTTSIQLSQVGRTTTGMHAPKRLSTCWTESCSATYGIGPEEATTIWDTGKLCPFISKPLAKDGGFSLAGSGMGCIFICVHSAMSKYEGTGSFVVSPIRLTQFGLNIWLKEGAGKQYFEYYYRVVAIPPFRSLSRMSRKVQVRFLGDKGGVTRLSYPTQYTTD